LHATETMAWIVAGTLAAVADYGLGVGFGLAASLILAGILGYDPRLVASSAALAQMASSLPAVAGNSRAGTLDRSIIAENLEAIAILGLAATIGGALGAAGLASAEPRTARIVYTIGMAGLLAATGVVLLDPGPQAPARREPGTLAAAALGFAAGVEKSIVGGGFTLVLVAGQRLLGFEAKKALALAPLVKMAPFIAVSLAYSVAGVLELQPAAALALGAVAATPLASRVLAGSTEIMIKAALAASTLLGLALAAARIHGALRPL